MDKIKFKIGLSGIQDIIIPHTTKELATIRYKILKEINENKFSHYVAQMKQIVEKINSMTRGDYMNSNFFDDFRFPKQGDNSNNDNNNNNNKTTIYWKNQSPWLDKMYGNIFGRTKGVTGLTSLFLKEKIIDMLVGDPYWMSEQQKILFKTMVKTYFSGDVRLWPVDLNMDFVFKQKYIPYQQIGDKKLTSFEIDEMVRNWQPPQILEHDIDIQNKELLTSQMKEEFRDSLIQYNNLSQEQRKKKNFITNIFKSALSGAGPFILKILQQIRVGGGSGDGKDEEGGKSNMIRELTEDIFSNIPGLTRIEQDYVFENMKIEPTYISNMNPKILGSASIAEAHLTYNSNYAIPGILKFIKPMYAYYFLCEINFLTTTFWKELEFSIGKASLKHPSDEREKWTKKSLLQSRQLLLFFIKEFVNEFDYWREFKYTTLGYEIYNRPKLNLRSIIALDFAENPFPGLVLQKVNGNTVSNIMSDPNTPVEQIKQIYNVVFNSLLSVWFTNTLWGDGFFHADLHPGNIMWDDFDKNLWLIDFGSCGKLQKNQQFALIELMFLSGNFHVLQPEDFAGGKNMDKHEENLKLAKKFIVRTWKMCQVSNEFVERMKLTIDTLAEKLLNYKKGIFFIYLFLDLIKYSDDIGMCVSNDILLFGRAVAYMVNLVYSLQAKCGGQCETFELKKVVQKNLLSHPIQLYKLFKSLKARE